VILCFLSVAYITFGGWVVLQGEGALRTMGLDWHRPQGLFELISNYGGINLAAGLFCLLALCRPALRSHAFLPPMIINAGYILGRSISVALVGEIDGFLIGAWLFEAVALALSLWGYKLSLEPPSPKNELCKYLRTR
jgi:hypothetical protein